MASSPSICNTSPPRPTAKPCLTCIVCSGDLTFGNIRAHLDDCPRTRSIDICPMCPIDFSTQAEDFNVVTHLHDCLLNIHQTSSILITVTPPAEAENPSPRVTKYPCRAHLYVPHLKKCGFFPQDYKWTPAHMQDARTRDLNRSGAMRRKQKEEARPIKDELDKKVAELNQKMRRAQKNRKKREQDKLKKKKEEEKKEEEKKEVEVEEEKRCTAIPNAAQNGTGEPPLSHTTSLSYAEIVRGATESQNNTQGAAPTTIISPVSSKPTPAPNNAASKSRKKDKGTVPTPRRPSLTTLVFTCADELAAEPDLDALSDTSSPSSISTPATTPPSTPTRCASPINSLSPCVLAEPYQSVAHVTRSSHIRRPATEMCGDVCAERLGIIFMCAY
ncbi:hypothetical protein K458DRAFT_420191 [Lentithecium fluviatile CBS 122367]|uniref:Uncharacterized protein n=1 Tax=Lentithecium fluviatile CBS 122367 TaxID=1168545 RepID=A0A6G1IVL7_9PLEO|nr:hypothetical protein K458DRAFT_420191 [Lentithecium fluviatile CBS 122367]